MIEGDPKMGRMTFSAVFSITVRERGLTGLLKNDWGWSEEVNRDFFCCFFPLTWGREVWRDYWERIEGDPEGEEEETFPPVSSITVAGEESERDWKKIKEKEKKGRGRIERGSIAAPFRPKESLVFWVEEEVQSHLWEGFQHVERVRKHLAREGKDAPLKAKTSAAAPLRRKKIIFPDHGKVQPHHWKIGRASCRERV